MHDPIDYREIPECARTETCEVGSSRFVAAIEHELRGVHFFSVGACPGCEACGLEGVEAYDDDPRAFEAAEYGDEFSASECDSCGSRYAGSRHPAHGCIAESPEAARDEPIQHWLVCTDCVMFHANGEVPENWYQSPWEEREASRA